MKVKMKEFIVSKKVDLKILIELPTWLGDCVMTTPSLSNIVNSEKDINISLVGSKVSVDCLKNFSKVDRSIYLTRNLLLDIKNIRSLGYFDCFISYRSSLRSRLLSLFVKADKRANYKKEKYRTGHQVEKYNDFINDFFGLNKLPKNLVLYPTGKSKTKTKLKKIGINPGAAYGSAKRWTKTGFIEVIKVLARNNKVLVFGSESEQDFFSNFINYEDSENIENLAGKTDISDLINEISDLDLFVTGDSGPMHIAAAFKIPTVSIFGPTKHLETSQWKNLKSKIIKENLECQPCMQRECMLKHHNCMKLIKPEKVLKECHNFLGEIERD